MGNTMPAFCRSVGDRSDLKNSRFDPRAKKNKNASGSGLGSSGSSKRAQVQPLGARIATVNTSFLNHTKSNVNNGRSSADNFLEELDCNFCKDTILNGAIAGKIANDTLEVEERDKSNVTPSSTESTRCKPPMTPLRSTISPFASTPFVYTQQSSVATTEVNDDQDEQIATASTYTTNNVHRVVPAIVHPETVCNFPENVTDNESEIIYHSVSTIPIISDKDSDTSDEGNEENLVTMIENEPLNKAKSSSLDEGIDLKLKRTAYRLEAEQQKINNNRKCNFCDFVKNGTGRSWSDLDKDVSMLMETVDKLSAMIAEKEMSEKHLGHEHGSASKVPYSVRDLRKQFGQVGSLDDSEEIVEEKKVSLSFLEKLSGLDDLKEKVQQLRNKRRIGISLMRTSHGKRLMMFSDGQNTYQIQVSKPQFDESLKKDGDGGGSGGTLQQRTQHQLPPSGSSLVVKEVTTGTTSSSDGGSSHRLRSPSRSHSSLSSSLEPISQGVDTLEVCDKAAARLRELANHLEHGDIPNSVLQKTLQYAAYVLDTVSMDETRRCKLKKDPLRPCPTPPPPPPLVVGEALPPPLPPPLSSQASIMPPSHSSSSASSSFVEAPSTLESTRLPVSIAASTRDRVETSAKAVVADPLTSTSTTFTSTTSITSVSKKSHSHRQHNHHPPPPPSHAASHRPNSPHQNITAQPQSSTDSVKRVILTQVDPKQTEATIEEATTVSATGRLSDSTADSLQRRLLDEEDELAEVQPDAVPNEVRQWLASTFTRSQVATKPRSDDKPKFRSVANAIRAGIMVDRIYRRLFNVTAIGIPPEVSTFLKAADEWSFDVFALNVLSPNKVLRNLSAELLNRYGLVHKFKIPSSQLDSFLCAIEQGYMKYGNPYHNNLHAADVTQTVHYMLWVTGLAQWLTDLEVFATLIAAIIHDYQHTGTTNNFHINSNSDITLLYNDRSVLENFHISEAFKVMRKDESNIIQNLSREEYREFRTLIIEMVIATDMSTHFQQIKTLKTLLSHSEFSVDKQKGLSYILHSADISHPSKMFPLHQRWTLLLMEEFFRQGDMEQELGLAYSPLCDRNSTLIPQSQIGFIDFIVAPTMELCGDLIERVHEHINVSAAAAASEVAADDQVAELAAETKSQVRSQSSADSTATIKANGSSGPPSSSNTSRNTSSAPAYTRCSAPVILFKKLHRPWLKHLEENKNLWQLKAAEEAKQHADEKLSEAEEDEDACSTAETEE